MFSRFRLRLSHMRMSPSVASRCSWRFMVWLALTLPLSACANWSDGPSDSYADLDTAEVLVSVEWPESGGAFATQHISSGSESIVVEVASTANQVVVDTLVLNRASDGSTTAEGYLAAPVGENIFTANSYDQSDGGGSVLAEGQLTQTIQAGQLNTVNLVMEGVVAAVSVYLDDADLTLLGETTQAHASAQDPAGDIIVSPSPDFSWSSSDETIATVDQSGLVTAQGAGSADIIATETSTGLSNYATVTVTRTEIVLAAQ